MLVSTIITNGQALADIPNTSFYTASEALFAVQLSWEQIYAFLTANNDDYFLSQIYVDRSLAFTGTLSSGSAVITSPSSTTGIYTGMVVSDGGVNIPAGTTITLISPLTMSQNATGSAIATTLTMENLVPDSNRNYLSTLSTTTTGLNSLFPDGFFRLRLIQYQGLNGSTGWGPVNKMTIENYGATQNTPAYRLVGQNIAIYDPSDYTKYCFWYYPRPVTLTTGTDLSYPYNMIPEIMAYQVAAEIRRKQKADITPWTMRIAELYNSMSLQMSRDDSHGEPIKNQFSQGFAPYI